MDRGILATVAGIVRQPTDGSDRVRASKSLNASAQAASINSAILPTDSIFWQKHHARSRRIDASLHMASFLSTQPRPTKLEASVLSTYRRCVLGTLVLTGAVCAPAAQTTIVANTRDAAHAIRPNVDRPVTTEAVWSAYLRTPLRFEPRETRERTRRGEFIARGLGYAVYLSGGDATIVLRSPDAHGAETISVRLLGRRPGAEATARNVVPGLTNHLIGRDPAGWRTDVRQFARVRQTGVYGGIDLEFYGNQRRLEYDFLVAPGADPSVIRLRFDGAERIEIDPAGDLLVHVAGGHPLRQQAPVRRAPA